MKKNYLFLKEAFIHISDSLSYRTSCHPIQDSVHNRTSDDGNGLLDRQVDPVDIGWMLTLPTGATLFLSGYYIVNVV